MTSLLETTESISHRLSPSHLCRHCGLPVRARKNKGSEFCCYGCAFTFQILGAKSESGKSVNWQNGRLTV